MFSRHYLDGVQRESRSRGLDGIGGIHVAVVGLKALAVKAALRGVVPGGPPAVAVQFPDLLHNVKVGVGFRVQFKNAHCSISFSIFIRGGAGRESVSRPAYSGNAFPAS